MVYVYFAFNFFDVKSSNVKKNYPKIKKVNISKISSTKAKTTNKPQIKSNIKKSTNNLPNDFIDTDGIKYYYI